MYAFLKPMIERIVWKVAENDNAQHGRITRQTLEPIYCCISLSLLSAMSTGAKVSIRDHEITVQPPNCIQGYVRSRNGDSFEDLTMLRRPVIAFNSLLRTEVDDRLTYLKVIRDGAIEGLNVLVSTYAAMSNENSNATPKYRAVRDLAELYISYLLNTNEINTDSYTPVLQSQFNNVWSTTELNEICTLLQLSQNHKSDVQAYALLKPIDMVLSGKLDDIIHIITHFQTGAIPEVEPFPHVADLT